MGQSLKLNCKVTTVRGITSRVDIVWSSEGLELQRINEVNVSSMTSYSMQYTGSYNILQLSTADEDKTYECTVLIISTSPVIATNNITLNVTGKHDHTYHPCSVIIATVNSSLYQHHYIAIWSHTRSYGR